MNKHLSIRILSLAAVAVPTFAIAQTTAPTIVLKVAQADPATRADQLITSGLNYLKSQQQADGTWQKSPQEPPGISALTIRAFIDDPNFKASDTFLKKALAKLIETQQPSGQIASDMLATYNTAIAAATLAVAGKDDPAMKVDADKAIGWLRSTQWGPGYVGPKGEEVKDPRDEKFGSFYGGFGYGRHTRPDLSNSHFAIQALHDAGVSPDDPAFQKALVFLSRCQNRSESNDQPWAGNDGGFIYSGGTGGDSEAESYTTPDGKKMWRSYGSMTYAGLKSMIYAGVKKDDPRVESAIDWIKKHWSVDDNPGMGDEDPTKSRHGLYYYFIVMSKALDAYDEPVITDSKGMAHDWRVEMIEKIASLQLSDGSWAGEKRWMEDNPVLVTSYIVQALEEVRKDLKEHPVKN